MLRAQCLYGGDTMHNFYLFLQESFSSGLVQGILQLLPTSPFRPMMEDVANLPWLGYLNWFFPVSECVTVLGLWVGAISLYYIYMVALRWLRVIGS